MSYTIESVYEAIAAFNGKDSQASSSAASWLDQFRKSIDSWLIVDKIIADSKSYEATIFGAQTLRQKILFDFRELPSDLNSYTSLRTSIINHLKSIQSKISQNSSAIIIQLAAALADLYLQVPEWDNFVKDMVDQLHKNEEILLSLFKIFPEELYNRHLKVGENRRSVVEQELAEKTDFVLNFLYYLCDLHRDNNEIQTKIIECLSSWLLNKQCPTENLAQNSLIHSILQALTMRDCQNNVHDAACECIVNALFLVENVKSNERLAKILQQGIYKTVDAFNAAIVEEDQEKLQNYARIYCELCESFLPFLMTEPGQNFGDLRSLEMLLLVMEYHEITLAEMTFNVWYRLSEFLYQADHLIFDELRIVFRPYIEKYINALYKHCRLDSDMQDVLSPDSEIAQFRKKASESIKDVTFIVGSVELLKNMMNFLNNCSNGSWDEMESALFIISCVIHNIVDSEDEVIPILLNAILSFPNNTHIMLLNTTVQLLGNLGEWLQTNNNYLVPIMQWLISLSNNVLLFKTLAESIENICEKNYNYLIDYFDSINQIILNIENLTTEGQKVETSCHHLLRACTRLINDLPEAQIAARLEQLCVRPIEYLSEIINGHLTEDLANKENLLDSWKRLSYDPVLWLDRLAAIYRVLKPWQSQEAYKQKENNSNDLLPQNIEAPWLSLSTRVWQVVSATLQHFKQYSRIAEHACRSIRFLIRSMGIQSIVFIEELVQQMMKIYEEHPHSCFLYLASIIVDEYGSVENVQNGLIKMTNTLAYRSFQLLQNEKSFQEQPDTVDDLFRLAIRFAQRLPQKFFSESIFETLFNGAIIGLELDHVDANRSVSKFVLETMDTCRKAKINGDVMLAVNVEKILLKYGAQMMWHALNASLFCLSNTLKKEMAEIIFTVGKLSKEKQVEWLDIAIQNLPHDSGLSATSQQLAEFKKNIINAPKQYEVLGFIRDLSNL